jgi:hypothetical protein
MGFNGTYTDGDAEFDATALVGKRSVQMKVIFGQRKLSAVGLNDATLKSQSGGPQRSSSWLSIGTISAITARKRSTAAT